MTDRLGRADLHIHSLASDGTAGILQILAHVRRLGWLDVIAITDHERIDAALAAREIARGDGLPFEVVVGEEITTRGGHLLALFIENPIRPLRSLRETVARVHDEGGLAIPAHPLFPFPMCAQASTIRRLVDDPDPRYRPDALEAFNPTAFGRPHTRVVAFAEELGLAAIGNSDAHDPAAIGAGFTTFPGHSAAELRAAIEGGHTHWHGSFHRMAPQLATFARQLRKYSRDAGATVRGGVLRNGTGRDLGYPGGHRRPAVFDASAARTGRPDVVLASAEERDE